MSSPVGYPQRGAYPMFSETSQGDVPVGKNGANLIPVMANVIPSSGGVGNLMWADGYMSSAIQRGVNSPRKGPVAVQRSALTRSLQTIWRAGASQLDIVSRTQSDMWLRTLKKDLFTTTASAGVASQFWRLVRLIALSGAAVVPTATPSAQGAYTTAARNMHPDTGSGGQTVASGIIFGSSNLNDAISWAVTVPPSGVVQALLFNSSGAANKYSVSCGGQTKTGTLAQSTTTGLLPQVVTLYGCTPGAQTLTVTKTSASGSLYTAGLCVEPGVAAPASASSLIYWFDASSRYIDGDGANELAMNIGGTFYGSYHGGHYGSTAFKLDGAATDLTSGGPVFSAYELAVEHEGRIGSISILARTALAADGHTFDARLSADALAMTEAHVMMAGCRPDMDGLNGEAIIHDSAYRTLSRSSPYIDIYSSERAKAITAVIESISVNGGAATGLYSQSVGTGVSGYSKGYVSLPIASLSSLDMRTSWTY